MVIPGGFCSGNLNLYPGRWNRVFPDRKWDRALSKASIKFQSRSRDETLVVCSCPFRQCASARLWESKPRHGKGWERGAVVAQAHFLCPRQPNRRQPRLEVQNYSYRRARLLAIDCSCNEDRVGSSYAGDFELKNPECAGLAVDLCNL